MRFSLLLQASKTLKQTREAFVVIGALGINILKDYENASPRLNPLFHKP